MTISAEAFAGLIFDVALEDGNVDVDIDTRTRVLWIAGITLLADVLLRADEFTRERLLRGLEHELRNAVRDIPKTMHGQLQ